MDDFSLFSDWKLCSSCGLPPSDHGDTNKSEQNTKLLSCSRCHSAAYPNVRCQRAHWNSGHKHQCKKLQNAIKPLLELMKWHHRCNEGMEDSEYTSWITTDMIGDFLIDKNRALWQRGVEEWDNTQYSSAMDMFQRYLSPYQNAWYTFPNKRPFFVQQLSDTDKNRFCESALRLAKRLLFCAYCELDGDQIDSARQRLAQSLSLLITIQSLPACPKREVKTNMDDAWMELTLSMEEIPSDRVIARHVAKMAINTKSSNWVQILEEYKSLTKYNSHDWHDVGSGQRGSGHDDHRVVIGRSWTEYVLFGTGAFSESDNDAPVTKQLIRKYVPDAISLARMGGGEVIFSRLAGGTHIQAHCGPTNIRWTAHLGLVVPGSTKDCRIRVAEEWHSWEAGRLLLFDDSYEHEVVNNTNEERVVLLMRLWHPQIDSSTRNEVLMGALSMKEESVNKRYYPPK
eukprot:CCRYP_015627-RA/>CCRYP_015627-RA protein AED:0.22 eAED:0.22 QI:0/0/0/1/1/1/2/0/454